MMGMVGMVGLSWSTRSAKLNGLEEMAEMAGGLVGTERMEGMEGMEGVNGAMHSVALVDAEAKACACPHVYWVCVVRTGNDGEEMMPIVSVIAPHLGMSWAFLLICWQKLADESLRRGREVQTGNGAHVGKRAILIGSGAECDRWHIVYVHRCADHSRCSPLRRGQSCYRPALRPFWRRSRSWPCAPTSTPV